MNVEKILRLADKIVGAGDYEAHGPLPADKLTKHTWASKDGRMCAISHAAADPWFNHRGLRLQRPAFLLRSWAVTPAFYRPGKGPLTAWDAVDAFFELDSFESRVFMDINTNWTGELPSAETAANWASELRAFAAPCRSVQATTPRTSAMV